MPGRNRTVERMAAWVGEREYPGRERRVHVSMPAAVEVAPGQFVTAEILDLSQQGFRLVCEAPLKIDQAVRLSTRRETVDGRIRWVDGLEAGGIFTTQVGQPLPR